MPIVFDIETDGLLDQLTKVHVMSWSEDGKIVNSTNDYDKMREVLSVHDTLIGHYITRFDVPALEKILGVTLENRLIDTLALSWHLHPNRSSHGLEGYGVEYGVPKPKIADWDSLTYEEYRHRCEEDVKINWRLWRDLSLKLDKLYAEAQDDKDRFIDYLTFKMNCMREQEEMRWKLDVPMAQKAFDEIMTLKEEKEFQLSKAMPKRILTSTRSRPAQMYNKDGSMSKRGEKWEVLCRSNHMPSTSKTITVKVGEEDANPSSTPQVKEWLMSLGWEPRTFKYTRNKITGEEKTIEQVRKDGELCESVLELAEVDPTVNLLDGLTVLTHRAGILKSFLEGHEDGWLVAGVAGFTNTLRFRHAKPLVNLPSVDKPYGDVVRGVLTCPEGYTLCGADMTSLEDTTKRHYMQPLDPDYVEEMARDGFDPHLDLAKFAGVVTQHEIDEYNLGNLPHIKNLRKAYKVVNYSATYGVGAAKLAREAKMTVNNAKKLLTAFWERNWAIEAIAKGLRTRELFGGMWLYNPVSRFWYSLRSEKDRFSTLNQSTGVYCFDTWVSICRAKGIKTIGQFHDEIIALVKEGDEPKTEEIMHKAALELNNVIKLNVPLGTDVQFGHTYAEIH